MDYYDKGNHSFTYLEVSEKSKYTFAALRYNNDQISYENSDKEDNSNKNIDIIGKENINISSLDQKLINNNNC